MKKYSQLADLESLLLIIPDANIRAYAEESVNAYYSGAYRSAIVSIWIAIVLDIYYKVRYLAEQYQDKAAIECIKDIEKIRKDTNLAKVASWEREILNKAYNDIKMFTKIEFEDIERIQKDRHRCAHPVMDSNELLFQPTPELVRHYIRIAIEIVLSQPATIGKALIDAIENDIQSKYFPSDIDSVIRFLKRRHLQQPEKYRSNLLKFCLKKMLYLPETITDDFESIIARYILVFVAICREYPNTIQSIDSESISKIIDSTQDTRYPLFLDLILEYKVLILWELASEEFKVQFNEYLNGENDRSKKLSFQLITNNLSIDNFVNDYFKLNSLEKNKFLILFFKENMDIKYDILKQKIINDSIITLTKSNSYIDARSSAEYLIEPIIFYLNKEQIIEILKKSISEQALDTNNQIARYCEQTFIKLFEYSISKYPEIISEWQTFIESDDFKYWRDLQSLVTLNQAN